MRQLSAIIVLNPVHVTAFGVVGEKNLTSERMSRRGIGRVTIYSSAIQLLSALDEGEYSGGCEAGAASAVDAATSQDLLLCFLLLSLLYPFVRVG